MMKDLVRRQAYVKQWEKFFGKMDTNGVCIDVGGNIGVCAVLYEKLFNFESVVSYEPVPWTCKIFSENLALNGCERIVLNEAAVMDGKSDLVSIHYDHVSFAAASVFSIKKRVVEVPAIPFSKVVGRNKVLFLKIDCEGAEFPMLESHIPENVKAMLVEVHPAFCKNFAVRYPKLKKKLSKVFNIFEVQDRVNYNLFCRRK